MLLELTIESLKLIKFDEIQLLYVQGSRIAFLYVMFALVFMIV